MSSIKTIGVKPEADVDIKKKSTNGIALDSNVWNNAASFELAQRQAQLLASSDLVPKNYKGKIGNCFIALSIARLAGIDPLLVMQNLYVVNGNPSWSGSFAMILLQKCGKFKRLDYELSGDVENSSLSCRIVAERQDGTVIYGTAVDWKMIKSFGWLAKPESMWLKMPEQMIKYRSASFFARAEAPEALLGIRTDDELEDIEQANPVLEVVSKPVTANIKLEQAKVEQQTELKVDITKETGDNKNYTDIDIFNKDETGANSQYLLDEEEYY